MKLSKELIERCRQGDRQALSLLYTVMHDELLAVCRHYAADASTAEDLLHDSFLLIFSKISQLEHAERARAWMHRVTKNVALLYAQQQRQQPSVSLDAMEAPMAAVAAPPMAVTYDELMNLVDALPRGYRQVFRLSVLEGLSHRQIAALLGIEPHSSSSQLYRAKVLLRQSLRTLLPVLLALLVPVAAVWMMLKPEAPATVTGEEAMAEKDMQVNDEAIAVVEESVLPLAGKTPVVEATAKEEQPAHSGNEGESVETTESPEVTPSQTVSPSHVADVSPTPPAMAAPARTASAWTIDLAYSGMGVGADGLSALPQGAGDMNAVDSTGRHHLPVTVALSLSHRLDDHWSLRGSVRYSLLQTDYEVGNSNLYAATTQRVRYLGLGLGVGRQLWGVGRWSVSAQADAMLHLPLHSTAQVSYVADGRTIEQERTTLKPHTQWSVGAALSLHYQLSPMVGFFMEPSLGYYFPVHDGIATWRTDHRLSPELPLGLRITF